jgi:predicted nucleic acid-binding Zn ribbon protein
MKTIYENVRKSDITPLGEAIDALLKAYRLYNRYEDAGVVVSWEKLMGKAIANHTSRAFIKNKTFFIEITSAPLKSELVMSKQYIIKLLNDEAGKVLVDEVIFL